MATDETRLDDIIEPVEQKLVALTQGGDDEVVAARTETSEIYLPVRPICVALGVSWATQRRKIIADDVLMESVRTLRVQTRGGPQNLVCMDVEAIPLWLAEIEPDRVREELRDRLRSYKRWVKKVVYEAFARETGIETALGGTLSGPAEDIRSFGRRVLEALGLGRKGVVDGALGLRHRGEAAGGQVMLLGVVPDGCDSRELRAVGGSVDQLNARRSPGGAGVSDRLALVDRGVVQHDPQRTLPTPVRRSSLGALGHLPDEGHEALGVDRSHVVHLQAVSGGVVFGGGAPALSR